MNVANSQKNLKFAGGNEDCEPENLFGK
jgi:hypothetical protein